MLYKPSPVDVAKLVSSASSMPAPGLLNLFHFIASRIPELSGLWNEIMETRIKNEIYIIDIVLLYLCLTEETESDRAYSAAVWMVRQVQETERIWSDIERLAEDAGITVQYRNFPTEIVEASVELDLLLKNDWERPEEIVDPCGEGFNHEWMTKMLSTRIARREGDERTGCDTSRV